MSRRVVLKEIRRSGAISSMILFTVLIISALISPRPSSLDFGSHSYDYLFLFSLTTGVTSVGIYVVQELYKHYRHI